MNNVKLNSKSIGAVFALTLLIPSNLGINFFGINFEDVPLIFLFFLLFYQKIKNFKISSFDKFFSAFFIFFVVYTSFVSSNFEFFNQVNLRFYFYYLLSYFLIDFLSIKKDSVLDIFHSLWLVMLANFTLIVFQFQLPGTTDGWILNNTGSNNQLTSGRLGGFQGGGPNVIGIICAIYSIFCVYKILNSNNPKIYVYKNFSNTFFLCIAITNLYFTYSRGSYLALFIGLCVALFITQNIEKKLKIYMFLFGISISILIIVFYPSIFLKQSNRPFLNSLGINNIEILSGTGGGNYIKKVYEDYLVTLDDNVLKEEFNIVYSLEEKNKNNLEVSNYKNDPAEGYLKLVFDYKDNILPRSIVSFYYSNNGLIWEQLGSDHTNGTIINLLENDSFYEVGGWGDGQSPGGQYLSGYIKEAIIQTQGYKREFMFSEDKRNKDYLLLTPLNKNDYERQVEYKNDSIKLERPRSYWVALPNEVNLKGKDFEIIINLDLQSIPKGHETLFSQSSILKLNEEFNDQSWKWSIIDGRMYFFWVEDVVSGYSNYLGGQSLRSGKLISNNGVFDSSISQFSLSQYDEITTSHNGFLTMSVEYGLFPVILIVTGIIFLILKHFRKKYDLEIIILLMFLTQNFTNDLIYAPDVAIYFWLIPIFLLNETIKN